MKMLSLLARSKMGFESFFSRLQAQAKTAPAGCTTSPADANTVIHCKMH
jgi:hypothetical protein